MFGELIGVWIIATWQELVRSSAVSPGSKFALVECGPGRGTLAADVVRTLSRFPSIASSIHSLNLVETSPALREIQSDALGCAKPSVPKDEHSLYHHPHRAIQEGCPMSGLAVNWYDRLEDVDDSVPVILIAQELFDALPANQFVWVEGKGWRERLIDVNMVSSDSDSSNLTGSTSDTPIVPDTTSSSTPSTMLSTPSQSMLVNELVKQFPPSDTNPFFRYVVASAHTPASAAYINWLNTPAGKDYEAHLHRLRGSSEWEEGSISEFSPASHNFAVNIGSRIARHGGAALIVDYGSSRNDRWTLRGIRKHQFVDPLSDPGEVDLSVDVDFHMLKTAVEYAFGTEVAAEAHPAAGTPSTASIPTDITAKVDPVGSPPSASFAVRALGPVTQGEYLQRMGIAARVEQLLAGSMKRLRERQLRGEKVADDEARTTQDRIIGEANRLVSPEEMGEVYKVLAFVSAPISQTHTAVNRSVAQEESQYPGFP